MKHLAANELGIHSFGDEALDARMSGGLVRLGRVLKFLVKLFAGLQADKFNFDIGVGHEAGKFNHLPGEVRDFHRAAHIENEDFSAVAEECSL